MNSFLSYLKKGRFKDYILKRRSFFLSKGFTPYEVTEMNECETSRIVLGLLDTGRTVKEVSELLEVSQSLVYLQTVSDRLHGSSRLSETILSDIDHNRTLFRRTDPLLARSDLARTLNAITQTIDQRKLWA